jgi:hypothetical protein
MTHDELLIEINRRLDVALYNGDAQSIHALRTVVELHKPELMISSSYCVECTINLETVIYPCPTIRAIEKELG